MHLPRVSPSDSRQPTETELNHAEEWGYEPVCKARNAIRHGNHHPEKNECENKFLSPL